MPISAELLNNNTTERKREVGLGDFIDSVRQAKHGLNLIIRGRSISRSLEEPLLHLLLQAQSGFVSRENLGRRWWISLPLSVFLLSPLLPFEERAQPIVNITVRMRVQLDKVQRQPRLFPRPYALVLAFIATARERYVFPPEENLLHACVNTRVQVE